MELNLTVDILQENNDTGPRKTQWRSLPGHGGRYRGAYCSQKAKADELRTSK